MEAPPPIYEYTPVSSPQLRSRSSTRSSSNRPQRTDSTSDPKDECNSKPPPYSPALTKKGVVLIKPEFDSPFSRSTRRNWRDTDVEVNNTQIKMRYATMGGMRTHECVYSLQFAEVGLASDYEKKDYAIRLRVESKQYLFAFGSCTQMLGWLVALQMAISLALPLELRQLPEEVKRNRNRRRERERRQQQRLAREHANRERREALQRDEQSQRLSADERDNLPRNSQGEPRLSNQQLNNNETQSHQRPHHPYREFSQGSEASQEDDEETLETCTLELDPVSFSDNRSGPATPEPEEETKWDPRHHQSRLSEKDYPHITLNSPWEGKCVLYEGQWAIVHEQKIILMSSARVAATAKAMLGISN